MTSLLQLANLVTGIASGDMNQITIPVFLVRLIVALVLGAVIGIEARLASSYGRAPH